MRCEWCPRPPGLACIGETRIAVCRENRDGSPGFRRLARESDPHQWAKDDADRGRPTASFAAPPAVADDDLIANAESCPYRTPMPKELRTGCGCQSRCEAGRGPRWRKNGGVTLADCWNCEIAPRLTAP